MPKDRIKKNKWELILFFVILFVGIFFRAYHFSDWLHFEIDQTYDTLLVSPAVEKGVSNLPLLGPTAGGGRSLRLGPAFYYMEYLSARIFGDNPAGHAMQVLILSILALPLFYFFCQRYFSKEVSLGLLAVFSTSLYLVLYSRFSWSPNILPFLALATFYCLLRSVSKSEPKKETWFLGAVFLASITSQIHFVSFFSIPLVFIIFLAIKRPRFKLKIWVFALAIFFLVYSPVIISDIKTGGQNLNYFLERLGLQKNTTQTTEIKEDSTGKIIPKIVQDFHYNTLEYFLVVSGIDQINDKHYKGYDLGISCKSSCQSELPWKIAGIAFFLAGFYFLILNSVREKDPEKKNFLLISLLWFIASFLFILFITYDGFYIYPRFFLFVSPLAIIFLGLISEKIRWEKFKVGWLIFSIFIIFLASLNLNKLLQDFKQLKNTQLDSGQIYTEDIFPNNERATLEQQQLITAYMFSKYNKNGYPIYVKSTHEFSPVFWYSLSKTNIPFDDFKYDGITENDIYKEGNYFIIWGDSLKQQKDLQKYPPKFDTIERKDFGSLYVLYMTPKPDAITSEKQDLSQKMPSEQATQISQILTWKKLLSN